MSSHCMTVGITPIKLVRSASALKSIIKAKFDPRAPIKLLQIFFFEVGLTLYTLLAQDFLVSLIYLVDLAKGQVDWV